MKIDTNLIADYLTKHKITKTSFCKMSSLTIRELNAVLKNDKNVKALTLCKIVDTIGINLKMLIGH